LAEAGASVVLPLERLMLVRGAVMSSVLGRIGHTDAARAATARLQTKLGAAVAMLLLLAAFAYFYFRSIAANDAVERLAGEKEVLLGVSRGRGQNRCSDQLAQPSGADCRPRGRDLGLSGG
jgi:hypothetical protein